MDFDYERLIDNASIGLVRVRSADGTLSLANKHLAHMFGFQSPDDMIDHFVFDHPRIRSTNLSEILTRFSQSPDTPVDITANKKDGTAVRLQIFSAQQISDTCIEFALTKPKFPPLFEAIDQLSAAIAIYDSEDRRVYSNRQFDKQNQDVGDQVALGATFESYIRKLVRQGKISEAQGREEDWINQRLATHQKPQGALIIDRGQLGWKQVDEKRLPNGGTVVLSSDITAIKKTEIVLSESAARLHRIMSSSPIAAMIVDETGRYTYANQRAASGLGLTRPELEGRMSQDFFSDLTDRAEILSGLEKNGYATDVESLLKRADGSEFWALISVYKDPDHEGQKIAWYYDIDERQVAHQKLLGLSAVIEAIPEPIAIFDSDDRYTFTNKSMRDAAIQYGTPIKLGMKFENHLWNLVSSGAVPDISGTEADWVNQRMAHHQGLFNSFEILHTGGNYYQAVDMELKGDGRMTLLTDITAVKENQLELADARDQAEIANRAKSEFLATVSHELRTPLTSIKGSLGLLIGTMAGELSDDGRSLLEMASRNSDTLLMLINDLLDFEKIISGNMVLSSSAHDISLITGDLLETLDGYAESHGVDVQFRMPNTSIWAKCEKHRYEQVMRNLISNAVKFSGTGSTIMITMRCSKNHVRINVIDQGVGIPASERKRIFDHFTQVDSSDIRSQSGTGLGLPISKALIEGMGGTIGCTSKVDFGSTFYVNLPLAELPKA